MIANKIDYGYTNEIVPKLNDVSRKVPNQDIIEAYSLAFNVGKESRMCVYNKDIDPSILYLKTCMVKSTLPIDRKKMYCLYFDEHVQILKTLTSLALTIFFS